MQFKTLTALGPGGEALRKVNNYYNLVWLDAVVKPMKLIKRIASQPRFILNLLILDSIWLRYSLRSFRYGRHKL